MKKIILIISFIICISFVTFLSYADYGTNVEYIGNASEEYTVSVPAKLEPNGYGDVIVEGTWASNRRVNVSADQEVELVNSINVLNKKTLDVNFLGISENGNDLNSKKIKETILVSDLDSEVLFGEWKGRFDYSVEIVDVDDELYYGHVYYMVGSFDKTTNYIIFYKDKSIFLSSEGYNFTLDAGSFYFEDDCLRVSDAPNYFVISDDKSKLTLKDLDNNILDYFELDQPKDILDNIFPLDANYSNILGNTSVFLEMQWYRFSDLILSERDLSNINLKLSFGDEFEILDIVEYNCTTDSFCMISFNDFPILFIKQPTFFLDVFIPQSGLYIPYVDEFKEINFQLFISEDAKNIIKWNTIDVKNNKKVYFNGDEVVKVSNEREIDEYFINNNMYVVVDGKIIYFDFTTYSCENSICKYEYEGGKKYIINVLEVGEYNGVYFDEVGVYAFNFGKYEKNYHINIGKQYYPKFKNNLILKNMYVYDNYNIKFSGDSLDVWYVFSNNLDSSRGVIYRDGDVIKLNNMLVGIVSKDGKSIKVYKYLSDVFYDEVDDDVIFLYEENADSN